MGLILLLFILDRLRTSGNVTHAVAEPEGRAVVFLKKKKKVIEYSVCIINLIPARVLHILAYREECMTI